MLDDKRVCDVNDDKGGGSVLSVLDSRDKRRKGVCAVTDKKGDLCYR